MWLGDSLKWVEATSKLAHIPSGKVLCSKGYCVSMGRKLNLWEFVGHEQIAAIACL